MEWYGMIWNDMEWYGMIWNDMEWYGMISDEAHLRITIYQHQYVLKPVPTMSSSHSFLLLETLETPSSQIIPHPIPRLQDGLESKSRFGREAMEDQVRIGLRHGGRLVRQVVAEHHIG